MKQGKKSIQRQNTLTWVPGGPWSWGSHWQTSTESIECLKLLPSTPVAIPTFTALTLEQKECLTRPSSLWLLPYGSLSHGALSPLSALRKSLSGPGAPLVCATNAEGAKGNLFLLAHHQELFESDVLVATCEAERRLIERSFVNPPRVHACPLPVNPRMRPLSSKERSRFRRSIGVSADELMIVYAGRLSRQKNIHLLLSLFSSLLRTHPRSSLHLLGTPDDLGFPHLGKRDATLYGRELAFIVEKLGLREKVKFTGNASQDGLRRYLASCDLHLSLSTHFGEDFGYSIAQGLACGAPTAVTLWGGGLDFAKNGAASGIPVRIRKGIPEPDLKASLALLKSFARESTQEKWRKRALDYSRENLTYESVLRKWRSFAKEAIALSKTSKAGRALMPTPEAARRLHRIKRQASGTSAAIFRSVKDPGYLNILRAYADQD